MFYRIADVTLDSCMELPSFAAFACAPAAPDVCLRVTDEQPPEGEETVSGRVAHRKIPGGWFCHRTENAGEGLFISADGTDLKYCGRGNALTVEQYVRLALECLLSRRGYLSVHAAAVELNGEAYAFTGPSGIGKSSRARAWIDTMGASLISGDRPLIRVDTLELLGMPWDGKEQCFRCVRYPLKALFEVRRGTVLRAGKLTPSQARRMLVRQCFVPMWDSETAVLQMKSLFRLASCGRILRAFGGPTPEDASGLYTMITNETYDREEPDMKAKHGFILRELVGEYLLMPTGENIAGFNGVVLLNRVSAFVWEKLQSPASREELLDAVLEKFDVDEATAAADLDALLEKLDRLGVIETGNP